MPSRACHQNERLLFSLHIDLKMELVSEKKRYCCGQGLIYHLFLLHKHITTSITIGQNCKIYSVGKIDVPFLLATL